MATRRWYTAASVQDRDGARLLLARLGGALKKLRLIWVDGGDRGNSWVGSQTIAAFIFKLACVPMIYTNSAVAAYWLAHVAGISAQAWSGAGGAAMRSVPTTNSSLGVPLPRVSGVRAPVAGS